MNVTIPFRFHLIVHWPDCYVTIRLFGCRFHICRGFKI